MAEWRIATNWQLGRTINEQNRAKRKAMDDKIDTKNERPSSVGIHVKPGHADRASKSTIRNRTCQVPPGSNKNLGR
jgi:hypothetical protein